MHFELPDEILELRDSVRRLAQDKVKPRARAIDKEGTYPVDLFEAFRDAGLLGLCIPEEYGGSGAGILGLAVAIEEVAKYSNSAALDAPADPSADGPGHDRRHRGAEAALPARHQRREPCAPPSGSRSPRRAATSWGCGPGGCPTRGSDGGWVLNGTKCWMSGVREADWYTVFAKTSDPTSRAHDSITAFIVERAWDGRRGRAGPTTKWACAGVDTGELLLTDVHVPAENVIGEVGGFRLAMLGLNAMRPIVAARGIGLAEGALMYATDYVQQRAAFGKTIADFQGIQWEIAKCAVDIEAARLLTYRAAVLADEGKFTKEYVPYLSMAKYHATELAVRASSLAVQLLGAAGYMEDHPTEQWYRDAKQLTIVEGTSQVQLGLIARGRARTGTCGGTDLARSPGPPEPAGVTRRQEAEGRPEDGRGGRGHAGPGGRVPGPAARQGRDGRRGDRLGAGDGRRRRPVPVGGRRSGDCGRPRRDRRGSALEHQRHHPGRVHHGGLRRARVQARQPRCLVVGRDGGRARSARGGD